MIDEVRKKKTDALRNPETLVKDINKFDKQIKAAEASIKAYGSNVSKTIDVINNLGTSSLGDILHSDDTHSAVLERELMG